ncbi:MAG: MarC family protein [Kiritimatiellia bacterium]|jgi:multiple antibiotic resistance protein
MKIYDDISLVIVNTLYLLALINPISKVAVLSALPPERRNMLQRISFSASVVGAMILLGAMLFGVFILNKVFRVELYALQAAAGLVLASVGFNALRRGVFFEQPDTDEFSNVALVPLACPLIAGPATITAAITLRASVGLTEATISIVLAVAINYLIMRASRFISQWLTKFNLMGAIIRITGLVVMTMGMQALLDGLRIWWK